jgi:ParB family transcriptional regulator, chromosome partitioning protein
MDPSKRVLIVEADNTFALSLAAILQASGFASSIAADATEAQRDIKERRPSLVLLRAELPDLSGFTLCGRLRKDKSAQAIPIILLSSDATPEALAEHRSHPASAADGYLSIPFQMEELLGQVHSLLSLAEESAPPPEDAGPMITTEGETVPPESPPLGDEDLEGALEGALGGAAINQPAPEGGLDAMMAPPPPPRPPRIPKRPRRSSLTEEDRTFIDRVFESIADRRTELVAESRNASRRPPIKRELLSTPEGKLQVLREELNRREAQVARFSEIWTIRERELTSIDDKLHEKEVEIQGLKMQVDDLLRRLSDARDLFVKKDQEHGATVDSMLLDKFINEKELIEVVAAKEKDIAVLRRDLRARDDDLVRRAAELDQGREEISRLEKARSVDLLQFELRERQLSQTLARREVEILGRASDFEESLRLLTGVAAELGALRDEAGRLRCAAAKEVRSVPIEWEPHVR